MAIKASDQLTLIDLTDGYSVTLSCDSYTFIGDTNSVEGTQSVTTEIQALRGSDLVACKVDVDKIKKTFGITIESNNASPKPTLTITANNTLNRNGFIIIPVEIGEVIVNKTFSFSIAFKGDKGEQGTPGLDGLQGEKGEQGIPGEKGDPGIDGRTTYFHIKYSEVEKPTIENQMTEIPSTYIGTYVDFVQADSKNPLDYKWSRFKGAQGDKGDQGIQGVNGADGKSQYLHIAYADSSDGNVGFSTTDSTNKLYIGQYVDGLSQDSTDYRKYKWTKIKGEQGEVGNGIETVIITYQISDNATTPPTGEWQNKIQKTTVEKPYLWTKTESIYTDGSKKTSYSISSSIDGIQVGGSNLLLDTKLLNSKKDSGYKYVLIYDSITKGYLDPISENKTGFNYAELPATTEGTSTYLRWITWVNSPLLRTEILDKETVLSFEYQLTKEYETADSPICVEYYLTNAVGASRIYYKLFYIKSDNLIIDNVSRWSKFEFKATITDELFNNIQGGTTEISKESCPYVVVRIYGNKAYNLKMRKFKFEVGNKATDWTPAQEDVDSDIEDAKKTATNYLNFSDKGLVVGDMTKTTLGNNVLIDSDSVDIRNGENTLASFGANLIELGKNNKNAKISFCDGLGYINYTPSDVEGLSDRIIFGSTDSSGVSVSLYSSETIDNGTSDTYDKSSASVWVNSYELTLNSETAYGINNDGVPRSIASSTITLTDGGLDGLVGSFNIEAKNSMRLTSTIGNIDISAPVGVLNLTAQDYVVSNAVLKVNYNNVVATIGALNSSCFHIYTEGGKPIAFNNNLIFSGLPQIGTIANPAGNICIGNSSSGYRARNAAGNNWVNIAFLSSSDNVYIGGGDSPPDAIFLKAKGMSNVFGVTVDGDGERVYSMSIYNRTYTGGSYAVLTSAGTLGRRTSSSKRYKKDIISIDDNLIKHNSENMLDDRLNTEPIIDPHNLYQIPVMQYKYIDGYLCGEDPNVGKDVIGIIAEDVAEFYPQAAIYDENGAPEAWNSEPVLVGLLYLIQEQKKEIEAIKQQLKGIIK